MRVVSKLPMLAAVVAFFLAAIGLVSARQQIFLAVFALAPLAAGIGLLRKRVWSGYGFALFEAAQLAVVPIVLSRTGSVPNAQLWFAVVLNAGLALLFFFAGRVLAAGGAKHGWAAPWIAISALCSIPFFFVQAFVIPTGAMENTLSIGDRILTRVFPRARPSRGDIVVFHYPVDRRQVFVKRVIGVPGDRIRIAGPVIYRNGTVLNEPYAVHKFGPAASAGYKLPGDPAAILLQRGASDGEALREMLQKHVSNGEIVVPPGNYFVLGDNRDASLDSRYWGFVSSGDLIGEPLLIYDSQDAVTHKTRWGRVCKLL